LIALLKELPQASGVGVDSNERALQVARENAVLQKVSERAVFKKSNWCDAIDGTFDLIIANPPYIAEMDRASLMLDVVNFEPHQALFAGVDGLDAYRALAPQITPRLAKGGICIMEVGIGQAEYVMKLMEQQGLNVNTPVKDIQGIARVVIAENNL
jgi:release factor glutamine methyltransferase